MYASERDGDYYTCACGHTTEHSYLLSSRSGFITKCCRQRGWDFFEYRGLWLSKKPEETHDEVREALDKYCRGLEASYLDRKGDSDG